MRCENKKFESELAYDCCVCRRGIIIYVGDEILIGSNETNVIVSPAVLLRKSEAAGRGNL